MFKPGDKVKCINNENVSFELRLGQIYTCKKQIDHWLFLKEDQDLETIWYYTQRFILINEKPKTEIEFLDAFQRNFKEGV